MATIIDGKNLAKNIREELKVEAEKLKRKRNYTTFSSYNGGR